MVSLLQLSNAIAWVSYAPAAQLAAGEISPVLPPPRPNVHTASDHTISAVEFPLGLHGDGLRAGRLESANHYLPLTHNMAQSTITRRAK